MIMLSSQGCDAQLHISFFSRNARLIGMTIKRLPAFLTCTAAFPAHFVGCPAVSEKDNDPETV